MNLSFNDGVLAILIGILFILIAFIVFLILSYCKIFKKAGRKGWNVIVPFYNTYVLTQIAGLSIVYFILTFIPLINLIILIILNIKLAHKFGKSTVFGICMSILGGIFIPILAFGKSTYQIGDLSSVDKGLEDNSYVVVQEPIQNFEENAQNIYKNILEQPQIDVIPPVNIAQEQSYNIGIQPQINELGDGLINNTHTVKEESVDNSVSIEENIQQENLVPIAEEAPIASNLELEKEESIKEEIINVEEGKMFCSVCGNEVEDKDEMCFMCGNKL